MFRRFIRLAAAIAMTWPMFAELAVAREGKLIIVSERVADPLLNAGKLRAFAAAHVEISRISSAYRLRLDAAASDTQRRQLRLEARIEINAVVERTIGLNRNEYDAILLAARRDGSIADRILRHMKALAE